MPKKVDFCIPYELKIRELEYLTLLKCELERRGYTVALDAANALQGDRPLYDAEVVICGGLENYATNFGNGVSFRKAIELTTEQIKYTEWTTRGQERKSIGKKVIINAWGEDYKQKLVDYEKVPEENVFVLGHPVMDFCKPQFTRYYYDRAEMAKIYGLDEEKRWNIFISTFGWEIVGREGAIALDKQAGANISLRIYEAEMKSKPVIFQWLLSILKRDEEILIYRPHPGEVLTGAIQEMEKKYDNFVIIRNESVRQWMRVCDRVYAWISTSAAEAFFMKKPFYMLHPYPIDEDIESDIFNRPENFISDQVTFERTLDAVEGEIPYPFDDAIYRYYHYDERENTYMLLADLCEKVYRDDSYSIPGEDRRKLREGNQAIWDQKGWKEKMVYRMRRTMFYELYHDLISPNADYMKLRRGELEAIERRIRKCIEEEPVR